MCTFTFRSFENNIARILAALHRPQLGRHVARLAGAACMLIAVFPGGAAESVATDWMQFRGPGGHGRSDVKGAPLTWNDESNIVWKTALPGLGASSPIVHGNRVFLTCFTGYAASRDEPGTMEKLERHLLCFDLRDGKLLWDRSTPAVLPEQPKIREDHGYASSTPVTDGERIYTFYGKSGVHAWDLDGKLLWQTNVGSNLNGWGSATSPILHNDLLLVNASVESGALVALDKKSGKEIWRANDINECWHAPVLVTASNGRTEVVMAMPKKIRAFAVETGEALWQCDTGINWYMCPTPVAAEGIVYSVGGRNPNGCLAVRAGGRGDVTATHLVWKANKGTNVPSPVLHEGHLYFAHENLGVVYCLDAKDGRLIHEERLNPSPGQIYASPVLADGRLYFTGRGGRTLVVAASPKFEVLSENNLEGNRGVFNATAAFAGPRILLRSNRFLYCIGRK
jgi:outer membrane protein assembly factor BamB